MVKLLLDDMKNTDRKNHKRYITAINPPTENKTRKDFYKKKKLTENVLDVLLRH